MAQSRSAVILEPRKIKSVTVSTFFPSIYREVMGMNAMIFLVWMLSFKPTFSLSSFTFIKGLFRSSSLSAIRVVSSAHLRLLMFIPSILIPTCAHPAQHFSWCTLHISRVTIYSLDVLLARFGTSPLFHLHLTAASWSAYRFLRRQVGWSGIPISLRILHSLLWSTQSKVLA